MIKRLIFDVDNTIITGVSFAPHIEKILKRANIYSEETLDATLKAISSFEKYYDSYTKEAYIENIEKHLHVKLPDDFLDVFFEEIAHCAAPKDTTVYDYFDRLSKTYDLVLLTNYFATSQLNRLKNYGIAHFFKECYGEQTIKPKLAAFEAACGPYRQDECVMIGDSLELDIEPALSIGMHAIFVNTKNIDLENVNFPVVAKITDIDERLLDNIWK